MRFRSAWLFYNLMTNEQVFTTRDAKSLEKTKQKIAEVAGLIRAGRISREAGIFMRLLRLQAALPRARTVDFDSRRPGAGKSKTMCAAHRAHCVKKQKRDSRSRERPALLPSEASDSKPGLVPRMNYIGTFSPQARALKFPPRPNLLCPSIRAQADEVKEKNSRKIPLAGELYFSEYYFVSGPR